MTSASEPDGSALPFRARLDGWKEIAAHFGRGVRTVQRWEVDLQLPVRRIDTGRGQVTYAFVDELDRWRESVGARKAEAEAAGGSDGNGEPLPAAPANRRRRTTAKAVAGTCGVLAVAAVVYLSLRPAVAPTARTGPVRVSVEADSLVAFDRAGSVLWTHRFEFPITESAYSEYEPGRQNTPIVIDDVDGDGVTEVLFVAEPWRLGSRGLFCFNTDGSIRFHHQPARVVEFGGKPFAPPWRGVSVFVSGPPGGPRDIWFVSTHLREFPTVLERLDGAGHSTAEYWSNGQITSVVTGEVGGKLIVFVGAISNEFKGGSLAVLDAGHPSGSAPAASDDYRCTGCPPGQPLAFLVFPRLDMTAAIGTHAKVANVFRDQLDQVLVDVLHDVGDAVPRELRASAMTHYRLDLQYHVITAVLGERLPQVHALFERKGLLDHPFGLARDDRCLWPVRRWDGTTFVEINRPETAGRSRPVRPAPR